MYWNDELKLNIELIDHEHKALLKRLEKLRSDLKWSKNHQALVVDAKELMALGIKHFETEEVLLTQFSFPDLDQHRDEHRKFQVRIEQMIHALEEEEYRISHSTIDFVSKWFITHIEKCDRMYAAYMKASGYK